MTSANIGVQNMASSTRRNCEHTCKSYWIARHSQLAVVHAVERLVKRAIISQQRYLVTNTTNEQTLQPVSHLIDPV
jgi:hypothetical protein